MPNVTVELSRKYQVHGQSFQSVTLREPVFAEIYIDGRGLPEEIQPNGNGALMLVTHYETIGDYVNILAVEPTAECLTELSPVDSLRLHKAVTGFFQEQTASTAPPTGSSSDLASGSTPSSE